MENITIFNYKEAVTKSGTNAGTSYLAIESDQGRISCFDSALFDKIKEAKGMEVSVSISASGDFKNLVAFETVVGPGKEQPKTKTGGTQYRTPNEIMRTDSYRLAVDLCVAGLVTKGTLDEVANNFYTKIKD